MLRVLFRRVEVKVELNCVPQMRAFHGDGCGKRHRIDVGVGTGLPISPRDNRSPRDTERHLIGRREMQSWWVKQEAPTKHPTVVPKHESPSRYGSLAK